MRVGGGETWVSRIPVRSKPVLKKGRPGRGLVAFVLEGSSDESVRWSELFAEIEIHLGDGTEPYPLRGMFNGDAGGLMAWRTVAPWVTPGTSLPLRVHPERDDKVVIDWTAWKDEGGDEAAKAAVDEEDAARQNQAAYESGREQVAPGSAPATPVSAGPVDDPIAPFRATIIAGLDEALALGNISQEKYDREIAELG